jgi:hypothetical protein
LMWALLSELAIKKPEGRDATASETWKCLVMSEAGFDTVCKRDDWMSANITWCLWTVQVVTADQELRFELDVIKAIYSYGAEHGVRVFGSTSFSGSRARPISGPAAI